MPFDTEQTFEKTVKTGDADPAMQRKVVSIVGPTASGKTGLGIAVAKALARKGEQAEIINADAYQMYRGMDIGTAKASLEEQAQVRHHLIDIIEPDDAMSVARFQELAREKIAELQARGVRPILVGGSGLYARAAIDDISFPGTDPQIRKALEEREKTEGAGALFDELKAKDYRVVYDLQEADAVDRGRIVGLFSEEYMPTVLNGRDENYLCDATKKALEILTNNAGRKGGFLLMVEGSQIDSEAHANNAQGILAETRDFDRAVGAAMDYADAHPGTLVVVTADHETSGLSITSNETDFTLSDSGVGYHFGTTGHSGTMVPVYLYGTGAERINGVMDNTELSKKIQSLMGLE